MDVVSGLTFIVTECIFSSILLMKKQKKTLAKSKELQLHTYSILIVSHMDHLEEQRERFTARPSRGPLRLEESVAQTCRGG